MYSRKPPREASGDFFEREGDDEMRIIEHDERPQALIDVCVDVWERAVRATHDFLTEEDIQRIKRYVPDAFRGVETFITAEDEHGAILGLMGIQAGTLEMLFLAPEARGKGLGRQLLEFGIEHDGVTKLTVNEQNPQAVGFYEHMGFKTYRRTETDESGDPFPLLYMQREELPQSNERTSN